MKTKIMATLGAAALAMSVSATASKAQIISQPCETCGVALGAPLPEGVYFVDLEDYGGKTNSGPIAGDNPGNDHLGVNIPLIAWSTPFSFYDTRVEVLYAAPFTHTDGGNAAAFNRVDWYSQLLGAVFAHSFGTTGFFAGALLGVRTPDNFTNATRGAAADLRGSIGYAGPANFLGNGPLKAVLTFAYSGNFGGVNRGPAAGAANFNDNIYVDYTLTKTFGKLELGVIGYAQTDLAQVRGASYGRSVAVGPLIGYDFGKVTVQAYATREVASSINNPAVSQISGYYGFPGRYDTRGYLRAIVPLYVAPAPAAPVMAKY